MREFSLLDLLQNGVHFGHQQSRRHPKMEPYIFTTRNGVSIIDLEKTTTAIGQACAFVRDVVSRGGTVMFVGTKRQARDIVQAAAQTSGMPYVSDRWIGGLFTNFNNVRDLIRKLQTLKEGRASGGWDKYVKKEQVALQKELERLEKLVGGLGQMEALPQAIIVVDVKNEKTALHEAKTVGIPVVAMCDTNVNPVNVQYPVPANDDASKSIRFILDIFVDAIAEGRKGYDDHLAAKAKAAAEAAAEPVAVQE